MSNIISQSEQPRGTLPYPYPIIVTSSSPKKYSDGIIIEINGSGFLNLLNFDNNRVNFTEGNTDFTNYNKSYGFSGRLENIQIINDNQILFTISKEIVDNFLNYPDSKGLNLYITLSSYVENMNVVPTYTVVNDMIVDITYSTSSSGIIYSTSLSPNATYLLNF